MSGRGGSGNFGSGRTHRRARAGRPTVDRPLAGWVGMPSGTDITLAGSHCRDPPAIVSQAGWAPSPCRLPGPVTRYVQVYPSVGFSSPRSQQASTPPPPSERQKRCAGQSVRGYFPSGSLRLGGNIWESYFLGTLGIQFSGIFGIVPVHAGQSVRAGQSVQGVSLVEPCYFAQVGTTLPLVE